MSDARHAELLERFGRAWIARDVDALLALMADDAVYAASVGPGPGVDYHGKENIRRGLAEMFAHDAGADITLEPPAFFPGGAVARWTYAFVDEGGERRLERGVDVWAFRDGRITLKDAYRKTA